MKKNKRPKIGISIGDLNGIGLEVILKSFEDSRMFDFCQPIIFGSFGLVFYKMKSMQLSIPLNSIINPSKSALGKLNVIDIWKEKVNINPGVLDTSLGKYVILSLESATQALKNNEIDALVTAPINKDSVHSDKFKYQGHTDYLQDVLGGSSLMMMLSEDLKVSLLTHHIPHNKVHEYVTKENISKKIEILEETLKKDFAIQAPKIAVLGLNPHAGENGLIGQEEMSQIIPVIEKFKDEKKFVYGPYPADGFFAAGHHKKFDAILAMYHDQGLIPFKVISFSTGVNYTAGLSKVRTSPDHGTAYDIADKNIADPSSFIAAIFSAIDIFIARKNYKQIEEGS